MYAKRHICLKVICRARTADRNQKFDGILEELEEFIEYLVNFG